MNEKYIAAEGLPQDIPVQAFLETDPYSNIYSLEATDQNYFGRLTSAQHIRMLELAGIPKGKDDNASLDTKITIRAGTTGNERKNYSHGFGARHIICVYDHLAPAHKYYQAQKKSPNLLVTLKYCLTDLLANINEVDNQVFTKDRAIAWVEGTSFGRFIYAAKMDFGYMLCVLFPDGDNYCVGTLYPIDEFKFNLIKYGKNGYYPLTFYRPNQIPNISDTAIKQLKIEDLAELITDMKEEDLNITPQNSDQIGQTEADKDLPTLTELVEEKTLESSRLSKHILKPKGLRNLLRDVMRIPNEWQYKFLELNAQLVLLIKYFEQNLIPILQEQHKIAKFLLNNKNYNDQQYVDKICFIKKIMAHKAALINLSTKIDNNHEKLQKFQNYCVKQYDKIEYQYKKYYVDYFAKNEDIANFFIK